MIRKFALAAAAVAALSTVAIAPAEARWRGGPGPAIAFGAVAGALALGAAAAAASQPNYYYAPGYYPGTARVLLAAARTNCNAYYNTVCGGPYNYYAPNSYYYGN